MSEVDTARPPGATRRPDEVPRPTREQRVARGKAARAEVPRSSHAEFAPGPGRPDPIELLESQAASRVPELLPIRYGRMAVSAFTFFRGAALVMASDLALTPRSGLLVQACGDAHLSNFGLFASPERQLVFDINDFDETLPGPWEWDVKRLAASLEIAARENGYPIEEREAVVLAAVTAYRRAMRDFAGRPSLEVWYALADMARMQSLVQRLGERRKALARAAAKARSRDNLRALKQFVGVKDGRAGIIADPPQIVPLRDIAGEATEPGEVERQLGGLVRMYRDTLGAERRTLLDQYRVVDMARKVVGVGSVGTRCWIVLMLGDDERDPLFLQAKEAGPSVLEDFVGHSEYDNAGQRVVVGQRLMQTVSDIFLGWVRVQGIDGQTRDFYLRQLRDWKGSAEVETMLPDGMQAYGELCGWTLARAHARSGDRVAIAAYLGSGPTFDVSIREFAQACADHNERDHRALVDAIGSGRVSAESGL
ncbi:MAG TPA: DUF2252 domain-containing protein [Pseudonocardiaceae bacterium]